MSESDRLGPVLDAAYVCFTRHGVKRTTMDDIAREAGISRAAVYQYVRNKEDAFHRLVQRLLDEALIQARIAAHAGTPLTERLTTVLEAKLDLVLRVWRDSPAHAAELLGTDARLSAAQIGSFNTTMRDLLAATVHAARPDLDAVEFAELLLAFTRGLEGDLSDPDRPRRQLRHAVTLLVAGLDQSLPAPTSP